MSLVSSLLKIIQKKEFIDSKSAILSNIHYLVMS